MLYRTKICKLLLDTHKTAIIKYRIEEWTIKFATEWFSIFEDKLRASLLEAELQGCVSIPKVDTIRIIDTLL